MFNTRITFPRGKNDRTSGFLNDETNDRMLDELRTLNYDLQCNGSKTASVEECVEIRNKSTVTNGRKGLKNSDQIRIRQRKTSPRESKVQVRRVTVSDWLPKWWYYRTVYTWNVNVRTLSRSLSLRPRAARSSWFTRYRAWSTGSVPFREQCEQAHCRGTDSSNDFETATCIGVSEKRSFRLLIFGHAVAGKHFIRRMRELDDRLRRSWLGSLIRTMLLLL